MQLLRLAFPSCCLFVLLAATPTPSRAQAGQWLTALRQGGSWVEIPIVAGRGEVGSEVVPTLGVILSGCVTIWPGHTGEWTVEVRDPLNGGERRATLVPGVGRTFSYRTGARSRLEVQARWSEARDTTLLVWVGLEGGPAFGRRGDPCQPVYGEDAISKSEAPQGGPSLRRSFFLRPPGRAAGRRVARRAARLSGSWFARRGTRP